MPPTHWRLLFEKQTKKIKRAVPSKAPPVWITMKRLSRMHYLITAKLSFELGYSSDAIQSFQTYLEKYPPVIMPMNQPNYWLPPS